MCVLVMSTSVLAKTSAPRVADIVINGKTKTPVKISVPKPRWGFTSLDINHLKNKSVKIQLDVPLSAINVAIYSYQPFVMTDGIDNLPFPVKKAFGKYILRLSRCFNKAGTSWLVKPKHIFYLVPGVKKQNFFLYTEMGLGC